MAYVWQISIIQFKEKSLISGVILSGNPSIKTKGYARNTWLTLRSYLKKQFANQKIELLLGDERISLTTSDHGTFSFDLDQSLKGQVKVFAKGIADPLEIVQSYPMVFNDSDYPVALISDVDDTILVSYTASNWNRVKTILFTSPQKRKSVSFSKGILDVINSHSGRIFYVSKSESNLFGLLSSFIRHQNLPEGNLFLTPYLRFNQLLNPKKGKDYKERTIGRIIDSSTGKRFILMGDDTQQDMAVYARIAEQYPDRIFKIFIHKTRKNLHGNKKKQFDKLHNLAVPSLFQ